MASRRKSESDLMREATKRGLAEIERERRKREQVKKIAKRRVPGFYEVLIKGLLETAASEGKDFLWANFGILFEADQELQRIENDNANLYKSSLVDALKEYLVKEGFIVEDSENTLFFSCPAALKISWA